MASARLLAWIIVSKFADHLPLYRLEQIAARQQVPLPVPPYPHGLAWWVCALGNELVERLVKMLLQRAVLHADETPVQQLDPKAKSEWHEKAWLWAYPCSNSLDAQDPIVVFDYQGNREGRHVRAFLGDSQGHLVAVDDYVGLVKPFLRPQTRRTKATANGSGLLGAHGVIF
ncbi:MAG: transposase [Moraxellaceae bacterium]|nr:transposase [Moraxellaceae bacterium]